MGKTRFDSHMWTTNGFSIPNESKNRIGFVPYSYIYKTFNYITVYCINRVYIATMPVFTYTMCIVPMLNSFLSICLAFEGKQVEKLQRRQLTTPTTSTFPIFMYLPWKCMLTAVQTCTCISSLSTTIKKHTKQTKTVKIVLAMAKIFFN